MLLRKQAKNNWKTTPWMAIGNSRGGGGWGIKPGFLKESQEVKLEISRGVGSFKPKKPSVGEVFMHFFLSFCFFF